MEEEVDEVSLIDIISVLLKRRRFIILVSIVAAIGSLLFSIVSLVLPPEKSYLPNKYMSKSLLIVNDEQSNMSNMLNSSGLGGLASLAGINPTGSASTAQLAIALIKSNSSVDELNETLHFDQHYSISSNKKSDIRNAFLSRFNASVDTSSGLLQLSYTDIDPEYSMLVVNKAVEIMDRRFTALGGNKTQEQKKQLEMKLADVQVSIDRLEKEAQAFTTRHGVLSIDALANEHVEVLSRLRAELIMKDIEIENYRKFSTVADPVIRRLSSERDSIQTAINDIERGKRSDFPGQSDIPTMAFEYARIQRDLLVQTEIFKLITQQYEVAKLGADRQEPAFQVLEPAEVPDKKSEPSRGKLCILVTLGAFFLSIFAAFLLEYLDNVRKDEKVMAKLRGTRV